MSDDAEFLRAFHEGSLLPADFGHREHVRLAWLELRRRPLHEAIPAVAHGIRNFATRHGSPGKYHATITWALVLMIHERLEREREDERSRADQTFEVFSRRNADLLDDARRRLRCLYSDRLLDSELARRTFVLPDRPSAAR